MGGEEVAGLFRRFEPLHLSLSSSCLLSIKSPYAIHGAASRPALRCKEIVFHPIDHYYRASPATAPGGGCLREVCAPRHSRVRSRIGPTTIGTEDAKRIIPRRPSRDNGKVRGGMRAAMAVLKASKAEFAAEMAALSATAARCIPQSRDVLDAKSSLAPQTGNLDDGTGQSDTPAVNALRSEARAARLDGRTLVSHPGAAAMPDPEQKRDPECGCEARGLRFSRCEVPGFIHWRSAIVVTGGNTVKSHDKGSGG